MDTPHSTAAHIFEMGHITLRPLTPADISPLHETCYENHEFVSFQAQLQSSLAWQEKGARVHLVVLGKNEQLIGAGHVGRYGRKGEIADVIIAVPFRRRGFGTMLVQTLIGIAYRKEWLPLEIGVESQNLPALRIYEHLGFRRKQAIRLKDGGEAFILELPSEP